MCTAGSSAPACESCHSSARLPRRRLRAPATSRSSSRAARARRVRQVPRARVADAAGPQRRAGARGHASRPSSTACASCHEDVHLGQEGARLRDVPQRSATRSSRLAGFAHAKTTFALTGRHQTAPCAQCHKRETGHLPGGPGTAVRYKGVSTECRACHTDVHLGQLDSALARRATPPSRSSCPATGIANTALTPRDSSSAATRDSRARPVTSR